MHPIVVVTQNVQLLWMAGKLEFLYHEMEIYKCNILGLAEMIWMECSELKGNMKIADM